jgi:hypothetical protein
MSDFKTKQIRKQIDDLIDTVKETSDKILNRGHKIDDLIKIIEKNNEYALEFEGSAKKMTKTPFSVHYPILALILLIAIILYILYFTQDKNPEYITAFASLSIVFFVYFTVISWTHQIHKKIIMLIAVIFLILIVVLLVKLNEHWKEEEAKGIPVNEKHKQIHLGLLIFLVIHLVIFILISFFY